MKLNHLIGKLKCRKGQGAVEYALAVAAIVLVLVAVLFPSSNNPLTDAIKTAFNKAANAINTAG